MLSISARSAQAQAPAVHEFQIEAAFLFNFANFVDWPASAFADAQAPLAICILGEDPFDGFLDETVNGERAAGRPLVVQRSQHIEETGACQILFISRSESPRLAMILEHLRGRNVLTVSNAEDFGRRGGMVRFVVENSRVRLRINAEAAKAAHLELSSKLLRIAEIVDAGGDRQ